RCRHGAKSSWLTGLSPRRRCLLPIPLGSIPTEHDGRTSTEAEHAVVHLGFLSEHGLGWKAVFDTFGASNLHYRCRGATSDPPVCDQKYDHQQADQEGHGLHRAFHLILPLNQVTSIPPKAT